MFSTFVVPLDGSSLAERAVPYAVRLAQAGHGRLILMRAAIAPAPRTLDGAEWESDQSAAVKQAEEYLKDMAESLAGQVAQVEIVAPYGRAATQILETARSYNADGIVMATHGRTGLPHLLYGSVTEAVLSQTEMPVFVVYSRPGEAAAPSFSPTTARVLVPQDGSENDPAAVKAALQVLGPQGEMTLVAVIPPPDHVARDEFGHVIAYLDQQEESDRLQARDYLAAIARDVPVPTKVDVRVGDPASGIAMAAIDDGADLIVMATHGRTGIRRALLGSVAGTVLRSGPTPVMLIHPRVEAPANAQREPVGVGLGQTPPLF